MHNRRQFLVADDAIERFVSFEILYLYLHSRIVDAVAADNSMLAAWTKVENNNNCYLKHSTIMLF